MGIKIRRRRRFQRGRERPKGTNETPEGEDPAECRKIVVSAEPADTVGEEGLDYGSHEEENGKGEGYRQFKL